MYVVDTIDEEGNPWCPMCHMPMKREGEFCSPYCWNDFHTTVYEIGRMVEMNYLDLEEQPWYGKHHG